MSPYFAAIEEPGSPGLAWAYIQSSQAHPQRRVWIGALIIGALGGLVLFQSPLEAGPSIDLEPVQSLDLAIDPTSLETSCELGSVVDCNALGSSYQHESARPYAERRAFHFFSLACQGGIPEGCGNLGSLYEQRAKSALDLESAARLYSEACSGGQALGCSNLGALYARGAGAPRDIDAARWFFTRACEAGSAVGCSNLSEISSE
jgi:hypothetical protein